MLAGRKLRTYKGDRFSVWNNIIFFFLFSNKWYLPFQVHGGGSLAKQEGKIVVAVWASERERDKELKIYRLHHYLMRFSCEKIRLEAEPLYSDQFPTDFLPLNGNWVWLLLLRTQGGYLLELFYFFIFEGNARKTNRRKARSTGNSTKAFPLTSYLWIMLIFHLYVAQYISLQDLCYIFRVSDKVRRYCYHRKRDRDKSKSKMFTQKYKNQRPPVKDVHTSALKRLRITTLKFLLKLSVTIVVYKGWDRPKTARKNSQLRQFFFFFYKR